MNNPLFDVDIDVEDVSNSLIDRIIELETKCIIIQSQIDDITNNKKKNKRTYKKKELTPDFKAIETHYEENKNNPKFISNIERNLIELGYSVNKQHKFPTSLVRMECLKVFNKLSTEERNKYYKSSS